MIANQKLAEHNGIPALFKILENEYSAGTLPKALSAAWDNLDLSEVPSVFGGDAP